MSPVNDAYKKKVCSFIEDFENLFVGKMIQNKFIMQYAAGHIRFTRMRFKEPA